MIKLKESVLMINLINFKEIKEMIDSRIILIKIIIIIV
jgi:hypothetical protein